MKISELIAELEKAMAEHGDMPVHTFNSDGILGDCCAPDLWPERGKHPQRVVIE